MTARPEDLPILVTGVIRTTDPSPQRVSTAPAGPDAPLVHRLTDRYPGHLAAIEPLFEESIERIPPDVDALPRPRLVEWRDGALLVGMDPPVGETLDQLLLAAPQGLERDAAAAMIAALATALAALHRLGLVHADLRLSSIYVDRATLKPRLANWGHALPVQRPIAVTRVDVAPTIEGVPYASPDVLAGTPPRREDDVFALGCIAYEVLTGAHPFARRPSTEARAAGMRPPQVADLTERQKTLLERAVSMNRGDRLIALGDLAAAFTTEDQAPARERELLHVENVATRRTSRRARAMRVLVAGVLVLAGVSLFLWRQAAPDRVAESTRAPLPAIESTNVADHVTAPPTRAPASEPTASAALPPPPELPKVEANEASPVEKRARVATTAPPAAATTPPTPATPAPRPEAAPRASVPAPRAPAPVARRADPPPARITVAPSPVAPVRGSETRMPDWTVVPTPRVPPPSLESPAPEARVAPPPSPAPVPMSSRTEAGASSARTTSPTVAAPVRRSAACPGCDCAALSAKRSFSMEPLRPEENRFLSESCGG